MAISTFGTRPGAGPIAKDVKAYLGTEPLYSPAGERADLYRWVRERLSVPLLGRSRITDPAVALQMVEEGAVDLLGIGRQLLADPDFPLKTAHHRWDTINRCIGCDVLSGPDRAPRAHPQLPY